MNLHRVPVTLTDAKRFVGLHHRHNLPPVTWRFGVGLADCSGDLVGVGMAGNPMARKLAQADPTLIELIRCTVLDDGRDVRNACSMIYGALCRAAAALGYRRAITYSLQSESGASLRGAGFTVAEQLPPSRGWDQPSRARYERDLFGEARTPEGPKLRWERAL